MFVKPGNLALCGEVRPRGLHSQYEIWVYIAAKNGAMKGYPHLMVPADSFVTPISNVQLHSSRPRHQLCEQRPHLADIPAQLHPKRRRGPNSGVP